MSHNLIKSSWFSEEDIFIIDIAMGGVLSFLNLQIVKMEEERIFVFAFQVLYFENCNLPLTNMN